GGRHVRGGRRGGLRPLGTGGCSARGRGRRGVFVAGCAFLRGAERRLGALLAVPVCRGLEKERELITAGRIPLLAALPGERPRAGGIGFDPGAGVEGAG